MVTAHGLAASIRAAQESETFDLGGMTPESITATIKGAFATPLDSVTDMIRITLVTGAGKQARQKYDDGASRSVTNALEKLGYLEDRGASCVLSSAGSYKLQHDTGKNIRTVVIFPKLKGTTDSTDDQEGDADESLLPENSPGYKIAVSSMSVFESMVKSYCSSWSQKKGCLTCIEGIKELLKELDGQLVKGTPLSKSEQTFYDAVGHLDDKESLVHQLAHTQVDEGNITHYEKQLLLQQNAERITSFAKENKSTIKARERKALLESIVPIEPHKLKHHAKIGKLHKELAPLLQIEANGRNLLSMKEATAVARKDEIEKEIQHLEETSREWFEHDDVFFARVTASRNEFAARSRHQPNTRNRSSTGTIKSNSNKATSNIAGTVNKWVTPGENTRGFSSLSADKKKGKKGDKGHNLFGAMMMDSSSDEEGGEDNAVVTPTVIKAISSENRTKAAPDTAASEKPSKKKSKKKKKSKRVGAVAENANDDVLLASLADTNKATPEKEEEIQSALGQFVGLVQIYILPLLVGLLGWIIGLLFGKPKKQKRK